MALFVIESFFKEANELLVKAVNLEGLSISSCSSLLCEMLLNFDTLLCEIFISVSSGMSVQLKNDVFVAYMVVRLGK